jgi:transcriptional repressor NrdR
MRCPVCEHEESKVLESRDVGEGTATRRRRECCDCSHRFTTYERLEKRHLVVIKRGGERQLFDREKLIRGIGRACEKRSVTELDIEALVARIEKQVYASGDSEIKSTELGELVMQELADLDDVAYIRFASVYRSFTSVESFEKALSHVRQKRRIL